MIRKIDLPREGESLQHTLNNAFLTITGEMRITREKALTNPAFITRELILKHVKEVTFYGYYQESRLIGCFALEKGGEYTYYLERLGVIPSFRHKGIGGQMVKEA